MNIVTRSYPPNFAILQKPTAPKSYIEVLNLAISASNLPSTFDSREQWTYKGSDGNKLPLIGPILNQGQCGSCYIFASTEILADRLSMATGQPIGVLSQQYILDCVHGSESQGCEGGGIPQYVLQWMSSNYVPVDTHFPYEGQDGTKCPDSSSSAKWIGSGVYTVSNGESSEDEIILNIKKEIYANGPVTCAVTIYNDFMDWWPSQDASNGGVYSPGQDMNSSTVDGGHALKIIGWDNSKNAWLIANSWGDSQTTTAGGIDGSGYFYHSYNDNVESAPTGVNDQVVAICVNGTRAHQQLAANSGSGNYPKPYTCTLVQRDTPVPAEAILGLKESYENNSKYGRSSLPFFSRQIWIIIIIILILAVLFVPK